MSTRDNSPDTPQAVWVGSDKDARRCFDVLCLIIGWTPRVADYGVIKHLTQPTMSPEQVEQIVGEYVWDHLLGEPTEVSVEQLLGTYRKLKEIFAR